MELKIKFTLLVLVVITMSCFGQQQAQVDKGLLVGEWSRTESRCQIKITKALDNGKLELTYFDPKSINIGKAYWLMKGTFMSLYVELQDEVSPGSFYKLNYNIERDILVGDFFDSIDETNHIVEFVRTKQ